MVADGHGMEKADPFLVKYREWFEIVLYEHRVIKEEKWLELPKHVKRKEEIIRELQELEQLHPEWKKIKSEALNLLIHQLSDMEQLNNNLLQERRKELKIKVDDINKRKNNVRQLRSRYIEKPNQPGKKVSQEG